MGSSQDGDGVALAVDAGFAVVVADDVGVAVRDGVAAAVGVAVGWAGKSDGVILQTTIEEMQAAGEYPFLAR